MVARRILAIVLAALALPGLGLAAVLLFVAQTWPARLVALFCLLAPFACLVALAVGRRRWRMIVGAGVLAIGCLCGAWFLTPSADEVRASGLSVYLGDAGHTRAAVTQMVPEVDQFTLGSFLVPAVDPIIDQAQSKRIRALFQGVYTEVRADPAFAKAGSVMGDAYAELLGGAWRNDHLFRYPAANDGPARPVLLFLHGSAGNFLGYLWVLKAFADQAGWAIVAPDFGFGNWAHHPIKPTLDRVLAYIDSRPDLDGSRMMLAGLSNGGLGVTRVAKAYPTRFSAFVLFSPVIDQSDDLPRAPWFVLHGDGDRRIPARFVTEPAERIRAQGSPVDVNLIPGDHFIFFDRRDAVLDVLMRAQAALPR
jgi:predicted esterase